MNIAKLKFSVPVFVAAFIGMMFFAVSSNANVFKYIPENCSVIGSVNVKQVSQIESIKEQIAKNSSSEYVKQLESAGISIDNINSISFGVDISSVTAVSANQVGSVDGVMLISTDKPVSMNEAIKIAEKEDKGVKIVKSEVGTPKQAIYTVKDSSDNTPDMIITELSSNLLAIGTKPAILSSIKLYKGEGKSVLDDTALVKVAGSLDRNDMLWIAVVVPKELLAKESKLSADQQSPKIDSGLIYANYKNEILNISGTLNCLTDKDAQNILLPAQMLLSIAGMNTNNAVNAECIQLDKKDSKVLNININLPKKTLEMLAAEAVKAGEQQAEALQNASNNEGVENISYESTAVEAVNTPAENVNPEKTASAKDQVNTK